MVDRLNTPDILCRALYHKRPFLIPFTLDIGRRKDNRDPDGVGMVPLIRVLS